MLKHINQFQITLGPTYPTDNSLVLSIDGICEKEYGIESRAWHVLGSMFSASKPAPVFERGVHPEFLVCEAIWEHFDHNQINTDDEHCIACTHPHGALEIFYDSSTGNAYKDIGCVNSQCPQYNKVVFLGI